MSLIFIKRKIIFFTIFAIIFPSICFLWLNVYKLTINSINNSQEEQVESSSSSGDGDKLFCIVLTSEKTVLKRSVTVWNTWGRRCDKVLFACNCGNLSLEDILGMPIWTLNINESYDRMPEKVFKILELVYEQYSSSYRWFLLSDDDTYVFVDNLKSFISTKSHEEPHTYGYNYKVVVPTGYHSGGAGVLFTHEALKRMSHNIKTNVCNATSHGKYGDVALGWCAYHSNVTMGNSTDEFGRERFHALDIISHYTGKMGPFLAQYSSNGVRIGKDCCSDESISFHYAKVEHMVFFSNMKNPKKLSDIFSLIGTYLIK